MALCGCMSDKHMVNRSLDFLRAPSQHRSQTRGALIATYTSQLRVFWCLSQMTSKGHRSRLSLADEWTTENQDGEKGRGRNIYHASFGLFISVLPLPVDRITSRRRAVIPVVCSRPEYNLNMSAALANISYICVSYAHYNYYIRS